MVEFISISPYNTFYLATFLRSFHLDINEVIKKKITILLALFMLSEIRRNIDFSQAIDLTIM